MNKSKHVQAHVQAQRKFAVGAIILTQPERRAEPAPAALPPPEPRDVRHCGMSATQLLNSIMMMGIHTHTVSQPVVVLERLNENDNDCHQIKIKNVRSPRTPSKITKKPKSDNQKESPSKQKPKSDNQKESPSCRNLRSQAVNTNEGKKRRRSESSVTDVEDNRPLKFFRKTNRDIIQKNTFVKAPPKSTSTKLKRVSLRQMKLRLNKATNKNNEAKERRKVVKTTVSTNITKAIKLRKKRSSGVQETCEMPAITSHVRPRTAPHTRARHEATAAPPPSPGVGDISPDSAIVLTIKRSPDKVKTPKVTHFKTPRPRRRARLDVIGDKPPAERERCACGNGYCGSCERCSLLSSVIAMGDTEQRPDELERVVADLVDRAQRSPSARPPARHHAAKRPPTCPYPNSQALLSSVKIVDDTEQKPNKLEIADLADRGQHSPSEWSPALPAASLSAAPDVYIFNEETEVEAEPSPFRATRPRNVPRAPSHPPRSLSLDQALTARAPDTDYIIRILDMQAKVLTSYVNGRDGASQASHKHIGKLIQILARYKSKLLLDDDVQAEPPSEPVETLVIDDDVPKREPDEPPAGNSTDAPLAYNLRVRADDELRAGTDMPRAPLSSELAEDDDDGPEIAEAPAFYPTKEEMRDLNSYVEKVEPVARKYGIFKIVPPRDFQPPCQLKNVQFKSTNQYISSMYSRWGPAASEMTAIKAHLATQNVAFTRPPLFEGVEVDLVKLYQLVQEHGGLIRVMEERKWAAIAEKMQLNARAGRVKADVKLDKIYMKHLLPYETLSEEERKEIRARVAAAWRTRYQRQRARASRPLHRQRRLLGESESSDEDEEPEPPELATAFLEVEDCVVPGSNMNLTRFRRVGERVRDMRFPGASADAPPHWAAVERAYWQLVRSGTEHVCVHGAALDTSQDALGFPAAVDAPYGNHPWNLKRLGESDHNVLSSLGPTLAVTVPTLHLGMMFSTNCWHHDPHHLPWTEYMHQGPPKIWYGIADSESGAFRAAAEQLCPTAVQHKALWLPSDTAMLPPRLLAARGVRLVRALQAPGEYVVVLPRAFSCSISTGLTVSESLYFAGDTWLDGVDHVFAALRADAEPSMFALEALLEGVVQRPGASVPRLLRARALLRPLLLAETTRRREAAALGVPALSPRDFLKVNRRCSKTSWQVVRDECHVCRATLHWSKIVDVSSRVSVCLEHGLRLVRSRNASAGMEPGADVTRALDGFTTILFYSDNQISQLMADLDKQLN